MIKKADIVLGIVLLLLCIGASLFIAKGNVAGSSITVKIEDALYGSYNLSEDQDIVIKQNGHTNTLRIQNGTVSMIESDCSNQLCVHQGAISKSKQVIVCLPNHVVVSVEQDSHSDMDAVAY